VEGGEPLVQRARRPVQRLQHRVGGRRNHICDGSKPQVLFS
jgi:hypothetical protein